MGKETPLIIFPSEGLHPAWQSNHSSWYTAEESTNHTHDCFPRPLVLVFYAEGLLG